MTLRRLRSAVLACWALVLLWSLAAIAAPPWAGQCVGILDGDTVRVLQGPEQVKIRLAGIDAPEAKQPWGTQAKWYLSRLVFGQTVQVVGHGTDKYGRLLATLWVPLPASQPDTLWLVSPGLRNVNQAMVAEGYAWVYTPYARYDPQLSVLERQARQMRLGLWADQRPIAPWLWRKGSR